MEKQLQNHLSSILKSGQEGKKKAKKTVGMSERGKKGKEA